MASLEIRGGTKDVTLRIGDTQHFVFREGEAPFWAQGTDRSTWKDQYLGHFKGMRQLLWERGFGDTQQATPPMNASAHKDQMHALSDVADQVTMLEQFLRSRGHHILLSPKYHPEVAGCGIEYIWGFAKYQFRRNINNYVAKDLGDNVVKSLNTISENKVLRAARKTRDYCRAYLTVEQKKRKMRDEKKEWTAEDEKALLEVWSLPNLEKMKKVYKTHRNILDLDCSFVRQEVTDVDWSSVGLGFKRKRSHLDETQTTMVFKAEGVK